MLINTDPKPEKTDRKIAKVQRKTKEGQQKQKEAVQKKQKNEALIKASLKTKEEAKDSDWESVEEDYPHIQVDELKNLEEQLAGMQIQGESSDDEEEEKK